VSDAAGVVAVVSVFHPNLERLEAVLAAVWPQVDRLIVVDDAGGRPMPGLARIVDGCGGELRRQAENRGLAAALNRGIEAAPEAPWLLLLDQDGVPGDHLVAQLLAAAESGDAALGPDIVDDGVRRGFWRIAGPRRVAVRTRGGPVACDFLMTAGCLLRRVAWEALGGFDEQLFIDNVDLDFCFRARQAGWTLRGVPAATLDHRIGERVGPRLGPIGAQPIAHAPDRLYYMTRNRVHLYRQPQTPLGWVAHDMPRLAAKTVVNGLLLPDKPARWWAMVQGVVDGVFGRLGPRRRG